jgi:hypothetical protein
VTDVSGVLTESIIIITPMMKAAHTSKTSVNCDQTAQHNNPEDSHLHTQHCKNLKSHKIKMDSLFLSIFVSFTDYHNFQL